MEYVGPFIFNGVRFVLGSASLIPLLALNRKRRVPSPVTDIHQKQSARTDALGGSFAGLVLFAAASLQQIGIVYTTAGKAGFITGLYVILVPILSLLWRHPVGGGTWIGAILATMGLYFLSITETLSISRGDLLVLVSAFFWAGHVHILGRIAPKSDSTRLAFFQFATCALLSLLTAFLVEPVSVHSLLDAAIPILYGGIFSVGVAYTLQVFAQRTAHPAHAAIILSLEGVFAAFGGWMLLGETLSLRGVFGCSLMLAGMILSQLHLRVKSSNSAVKGMTPEMVKWANTVARSFEIKCCVSKKSLAKGNKTDKS
ncbi:DMT family transporter [candidate division KSB1 bacterium]|nr:DMT family transporter [candidate division KSB1 bacterium]NIR73339.1 DMT family transporter [candidate division KSB1 bacterium]NIS27045.1 DMT family transporter [candidate division KSB1 bacterium]NIT73885.1 DMT family transporter [candidate division KSB1 bacterium]NIU27790.1 DMT family transporter [candidate division KSB1 bacterium]